MLNQDEKDSVKEEKKSLKDEFARIGTALRSYESQFGGHKQHPDWKNLQNFLGAPFDDLKGPYVATKKDLKTLDERLNFLST